MNLIRIENSLILKVIEAKIKKDLKLIVEKAQNYLIKYEEKIINEHSVNIDKIIKNQLDEISADFKNLIFPNTYKDSKNRTYRGYLLKKMASYYIYLTFKDTMILK